MNQTIINDLLLQGRNYLVNKITPEFILLLYDLPKESIVVSLLLFILIIILSIYVIYKIVMDLILTIVKIIPIMIFICLFGMFLTSKLTDVNIFDAPDPPDITPPEEISLMSFLPGMDNITLENLYDLFSQFLDQHS